MHFSVFPISALCPSYKHPSPLWLLTVLKTPLSCFVCSTPCRCDECRPWFNTGTGPQHTTQRSTSHCRMLSSALLFCQPWRDVTDTLNLATIPPILVAHHNFYSHLMLPAEETFILLIIHSIQDNQCEHNFPSSS